MKKAIIYLFVFMLFCLPKSFGQAPKASQVDSLKQVVAKLASTSPKAEANLTIDTVIFYPVVHRNAPGLGDRMAVHLRNVAKLAASKSSAVLYIDDYCLKHLDGQRVGDSVYNFTLTNDQDTAFWTSLFLNSKGNHGKVAVVVAIGTADGTIKSANYRLKQDLEIFREGWMDFSWVMFGIISILVIVAGKKSNILRECCQCHCPDTDKKKRRPFSLARTQMIFWTILVFFAILYIYLATGYMPAVSDTTLVLLGISAATTVTGYLIDTNVATGSPCADGNPCCSKGFFRDIVSDNGVPGIHRFQNIIFTLLLGFIYFYKVCHNLQMTEFGTNLLLLMGISNGTYVGVKFIVSQPQSNSGNNGGGQAVAGSGVVQQGSVSQGTV